MIMDVSRNDFERAFLAIRPDNFTPLGLVHLFDHFTDAEAVDGDPMKFEVIAVCCAFNEYESLGEFHQNYNKYDYPDLDAIRERTTLIDMGPDGFIIEAF